MYRKTWILSAAVFVAVLQGCSDSTDPPPPVITASAVPASDHQSALVGTQLPLSLQVLVLTDGQPTADQAVSWSPSSGSLTITSGITSALGVASARWTLGSGSGEHAVYASVDGADGSPVQFTATALGFVHASIVATTNHQVGTVGDSLPLVLRIHAIVDGQAAAGIVVSWSTTSGSLTDRSFVTDVRGDATALWWLGATPGLQAAQAVVERTQGPPLSFDATANAGAPVSINLFVGDSQVVPANFPEFARLGVFVADRFSNRLESAIDWSVQSGPLTWQPFPGLETDNYTVVTPTGMPGDGVVRATVQGTAISVDFHLTASAAVVPLVVLDESHTFVSRQNESSPAIDTVVVGTTMTWLLSSSYWDPSDPYDGPDNYGVKPVGDPSFTGGWFSYSSPSTFTATFDSAGTYHYVDQYDQATGTVVVQ